MAVFKSTVFKATVFLTDAVEGVYPVYGSGGHHYAPTRSSVLHKTPKAPQYEDNDKDDKKVNKPRATSKKVSVFGLQDAANALQSQVGNILLTTQPTYDIQLITKPILKSKPIPDTDYDDIMFILAAM